MLLGLVTPSGGVALIGGSRYRDIERPVRVVGALLEASGAHEGRTGRDHLRVLCRAAGLPPGRAEEVLDAVGLTLAGGRRVREYSLGMRQRLGVATALLGDPQVLILDEPGNGLDPAGIRWTRDLLRALAASGRTVLVSSHQLAEVEQLADDLVVIAGGRVVAAGPVESVIGAHAGLEEAFLELTTGRSEIR
jgi:ABC-2 type transport system ATP-binding protein